jgi:hypothetical protein
MNQRIVSSTQYFAAAITIAALACPAARAATFTDMNFSTGWTSLKTFDDSGGSASFAVAVPATGGNTLAYREITLNFPNALTQIAVASTWSGATYDPSTSGPIQSVAFSWDQFGTGQTTNAYLNIRPLLKQGGTYYRYNATNTPSGSWGPYSQSLLTETNFCDLGVACTASAPRPNFSSSGGPIEFGYLALGASYGKTPPNFAQTANVDNYQVTIASIPEPATGFSALGAFVWLILGGRPRRAV